MRLLYKYLNYEILKNHIKLKIIKNNFNEKWIQKKHMKWAFYKKIIYRIVLNIFNRFYLILIYF